MATVNKDFRIKSGLIVEGTTATVNNYDILTKKQADQDYIIDLIGGTATSANEANKVVKRDASGNFAAQDVTVNTLYVGGSTDNGIDVVNGDTEIGSNNGIRLSASDDIVLASDSGDIFLNPDGTVYVGSTQSANARVAVVDDINNTLTTAQQYADAAATAAAGAVASDLTDHESATAAH
ncbi:MAG: hypothetical protein WCI60_03935, partial [bacterium]